jgi:hypothetical protein
MVFNNTQTVTHAGYIPSDPLDLFLDVTIERGRATSRYSGGCLVLETTSLFGWLVADGRCWFVVREEYCWLVAGGWFVLREKYCWLVADKPSEQAAH